MTICIVWGAVIAGFVTLGFETLIRGRWGIR